MEEDCFWNLSEGESFERGDTLLEVETDKMVAEVPALESGTLLKILVEEQTKVKVETSSRLLILRKSFRKLKYQLRRNRYPHKTHMNIFLLQMTPRNPWHMIKIWNDSSNSCAED